MFKKNFWDFSCCKLIYCQPVSKFSIRALWQQGRKRKESWQLHLWKLNFTLNSPVAPCGLSCQISANQQCEKKIEKHDISNVISVNQHFTSTFLIQIFNFKRLYSCKLSFLFLPCHLSAYAHRLIKGLFTWRWGTQVGEVTCCPYNLSFEFDHIYMISGVTSPAVGYLTYLGSPTSM